MVFMADVQLPCEICNGKRFKKEVLEVAFAGKNINDILTMTIDDAVGFFEANLQHKITQKTKTAPRCGTRICSIRTILFNTFRRRSATHKTGFISSKRSNKRTGHLFVFDEPTTGLHFHDIKKLLASFNALIEKGHSILVIEHNLDLIKCADWIIDLGPEGGENGGKLLAEGTPEDIIKIKDSVTGHYLKDKL